jgi:hypothetical protein
MQPKSGRLAARRRHQLVSRRPARPTGSSRPPPPLRASRETRLPDVADDAAVVRWRRVAATSSGSAGSPTAGPATRAWSPSHRRPQPYSTRPGPATRRSGLAARITAGTRSACPRRRASGYGGRRHRSSALGLPAPFLHPLNP